MTVRGWSQSDLTKARKRIRFEDTLLDFNSPLVCDFCGMPLSGVSYERLVDGRLRCNDCSMTAINSREEFKKLYVRTEIMMENVYNISIPVSINIVTADARVIAKRSGSVFKPSTKFAIRATGFAQRRGTRYSIYIENGSPRLRTIDTITHELTHIWQYLNWDEKEFNRVYTVNSFADPKLNRIATKIVHDLVYEGMAVWVANQMLYALGETAFADKQDALMNHRNDVYGLGYALYKDRFGIDRSGDNPAIHPFMSFPTIEPEDALLVAIYIMKGGQ